ncbi:hypothetical protein DW058_03865 [Clostridiaceae bacterium AF42-6]|nr:hypothetical protein DW058_03865 [Clostridiaceae bacterium AF42-6]RHP49378.1 hypothetical protein DWZ37_11930 [Clostridiaceae bacterium AF31-3BH]RHQ26072.1 hypothetical protein DWZ08_03685 [Clostridiaceae bacterium AF29-16BH]RHW03991.1 hypothetical protein DXA90_07295 [Clostridiaceae bacterium OF09-1]
MGLQLIFAVETNKKCNSDWIYIKDTIEHFYSYERTQVKFSVVYMDGKGNYNSNKKEKEIKSLTAQYRSTSKTNRTSVIYCFDCDDYDNKIDDRNFLGEAKKYCDGLGYEFVWFCKDVEQVYIGRKVDDSQKKKEAATFKARKQISTVDSKKLLINNYQINTSNIMSVLDHYPELRRKR